MLRELNSGPYTCVTGKYFTAWAISPVLCSSIFLSALFPHQQKAENQSQQTYIEAGSIAQGQSVCRLEILDPILSTRQKQYMIYIYIYNINISFILHNSHPQEVLYSGEEVSHRIHAKIWLSLSDRRLTENSENFYAVWRPFIKLNVYFAYVYYIDIRL